MGDSLRETLLPEDFKLKVLPQPLQSLQTVSLQLEADRKMSFALEKPLFKPEVASSISLHT